MPHSRLDRVRELVREEVSRILVEGLRDPRIGFVTVTDAEVSPDLHYARIFVSCYGDKAAQEETLAGLASASAFIRSELGRRIRLKHTPELTFIHDETVERADRIERLLQQISQEEPLFND